MKPIRTIFIVGVVIGIVMLVAYITTEYCKSHDAESYVPPIKNTPTPVTVCGRPAKDDLTMYVYEGNSSPGDPNYGYITPCLPSSPTCNPTPNKCTTTQMMTTPSEYGDPKVCTDIPMTCSPLVDAGCRITQLPPACTQSKQCSIVPSNSTFNFVCQSNWDTIKTEENYVNCCSNIQTDSDHCDPEWCSGNPDVCQPKMAQYCTADKWSSGDYHTAACDQYVSIQTQLGTMLGACPGNPTGVDWNCAQQLIYNTVDEFYKTNAPSDDSPFVAKAVEMCSMYPGLCDPILSADLGGICKNYKSDDLAPVSWAGRTNDPDGTNLLKTCGCFLSTDPSAGNYSLNDSLGMSVSCNAICAFPDTIPIYDPATGKGEQCVSNTCVLDNITVDIMNSNVGAVTLTQTCGQCGPTELCQCYFNNVSIDDVNSSDVQLQIKNNCNVCFDYNPADPSSAKQVPCSNPLPPVIPPVTPPSNNNPPPSPKGWFSTHEKTVVIAAFVGFLILFLIIVAVLFTHHKADSSAESDFSTTTGMWNAESLAYPYQ